MPTAVIAAASRRLLPDPMVLRFEVPLEQHFNVAVPLPDRLAHLRLFARLAVADRGDGQRGAGEAVPSPARVVMFADILRTAPGQHRLAPCTRIAQTVCLNHAESAWLQTLNAPGGNRTCGNEMLRLLEAAEAKPLLAAKVDRLDARRIRLVEGRTGFDGERVSLDRHQTRSLRRPRTRHPGIFCLGSAPQHTADNNAERHREEEP